MYFLYRFLILFTLTTSLLSSSSLENKYPNYSYVFNEFDVDMSYIYDRTFIKFVEKNEQKLKKFYARSLTRGEEILPMLQGLLIEDGISDLFIYLSMIESGFSTTIVSPKKAVGLWQFMPETARQYKLTVCNSYDERCDAVSATSAAIRYLNKLHKQFGKWYLAAMAYNCGEGRLARAIKKANSDDLSILTNDQNKFLPKETRDYIRKILLIAMIGESSIIGFEEEIQSNNGLVKVEVHNSTPLQTIAKIINIDTKKLLKLNTQYKNGKLPKDKIFHKITIPLEKIYAFYLRYNAPTEENCYVDRSHMITHEVKMGETLQSIAKLYEADVDEIRVANHLEYPFLQLDSLLVIPVSKKIFDQVAQ